MRRWNGLAVGCSHGLAIRTEPLTTVPPPLLFVGPSGYDIEPALFTAAGVRLQPPVRRGDVQRQVDGGGPPGVLVIADGVFQAALAVGHAELCAALDGGWQVWGVSSLGAIRAHELRHEGMRGFGEVFATFGRCDDFTDDELCLLHFPEPPWFPVSEALVNLRHALDSQGPSLGIAAAAGAAVVEGLRGLWFGERTHERIRALLCERGGCSPAQANRLLSWLAANRLKTLDLQRLLRVRPWCDAPGRTP
ncbi:MAG: hypothetical protein CFE45_42550 [Burkholderiales bacterium PBB5]|nr:MAG: hypothetical protein CFE45_42550 [Burkholderiales bacterium PBB5]